MICHPVFLIRTVIRPKTSKNFILIDHLNVDQKHHAGFDNTLIRKRFHRKRWILGLYTKRHHKKKNGG